MRNRIQHILVDFSNIRYSAFSKVLSFLVGFVIFMVLLPAGYFFAGKLVNRWISIPCNRILEIFLATVSAAVGLTIQFWSLLTQWISGRGGPVPITPTQKLITTGPYEYCRNPLHFGTLFYCFAFGTFWGNLTIGIVCIVFEFVLLMAYIKGIEEQELALRFGQEYLEYKENTPFLIPKLKRDKTSNR